MLRELHLVHQDHKRLISIAKEANEEMSRKFEFDEALLHPEISGDDWR